MGLDRVSSVPEFVMDAATGTSIVRLTTHTSVDERAATQIDIKGIGHGKGHLPHRLEDRTCKSLERGRLKIGAGAYSRMGLSCMHIHICSQICASLNLSSPRSR